MVPRQHGLVPWKGGGVKGRRKKRKIGGDTLTYRKGFGCSVFSHEIEGASSRIGWSVEVLAISGPWALWKSACMGCQNLGHLQCPQFAIVGRWVTWVANVYFVSRFKTLRNNECFGSGYPRHPEIVLGLQAVGSRMGALCSQYR